MRLVVRVKVKPLALWQYMGQYDIKPSDPLSLQEWTMQSELVRVLHPMTYVFTVTEISKTKKSWVRYMYRKGWGGNVRARIQFRRREGREPTEAEEDELDTPDPGVVTEAEIREAFDNGEEVSLAHRVTLDGLAD